MSSTKSLKLHAAVAKDLASELVKSTRIALKVNAVNAHPGNLEETAKFAGYCLVGSILLYNVEQNPDLNWAEILDLVRLSILSYTDEEAPYYMVAYSSLHKVYTEHKDDPEFRHQLFLSNL